jgi:P27 family predicted phage terminase small subunit
LPVPPKPSERRQRRNAPSAAIVALPVQPMVLPDAPGGVLSVTRQRWQAFWRSPLAGAVAVDSDLPALERLFSLYDERERAYRAYRRERLVTGSQGQTVLHPLGRMMGVMDSEIRQLEDRFGLNPLARARLGITIGEAARTLADMNRMLEEDDA